MARDDERRREDSEAKETEKIEEMLRENFSAALPDQVEELVGREMEAVHERLYERIEDRLRREFEDSLPGRIETELEREEEKCSEKLAEEIEERLQAEFEDSLADRLADEVERRQLSHGQLLTRSEVAKRLGLTPERIRQLEATGQLQSIATADGKPLYTAAAVRVLKSNRRQTGPSRRGR